MNYALLLLAAALPTAEPPTDFAAVRPLVQKYCLACHSTKAKKGDLDLERFVSVDDIRKDVKPWQLVIEMLEAGEMPPKDKPQPSAEERKQIIAWTRTFLDAEARARKGDPGRVPLRRLSHAEYDATVRDLTGVDLRPAREFPADGAGGEGFTNAAESLADISPALLDKYLAAAKEIAAHAVLLPDGFRFSPSKTRRDWTDECNASLRAFFAEFTPDGKLPLRPYLLEAVRHRDELSAGRSTPELVATRHKLNPKYFGILWQALSDKSPSFPLDEIQRLFRAASEKNVDDLVRQITAWQGPLWKTVPIGSYRDHQTIREQPNDPAVVPVQTLRVSVKPAPGQNDVVLYLSARDLLGGDGRVVWQRPRLEAPGKPALLLSEYPRYAPQYEVDFATIFADTAKYLDAAIEVTGSKKLADEIARIRGLDAEFLKRWIDLVALTTAGDPFVMRDMTAVPVELLGEKTTQFASITGWKRRGTDLPSLVANSSDRVENIPGRVPPRKVAVHPTPQRFVGVAWKSPIEGRVRISAKITHAHPACGNGVAWFVEHRRGNGAVELGKGATELGKESNFTLPMRDVKKDDVILLAVDARDANHVCDLTDIDLTIEEKTDAKRHWDLATDIAGNVTAGNPHGVWSFVEGPAKPTGYFAGPGATIPAGSLLARWRDAASEGKRDAAGTQAGFVQHLLTSARPAREKDPDRLLFDYLVSFDGPLLAGLDLTRFNKPRSANFGLPKDRVSGADLNGRAREVIAVRFPAAMFRGREFVVEARLDPAEEARAARFQVATTPPGGSAAWDGKSPLVGSQAAHEQLRKGFAAFRNVFPQVICFPQIIPTDEVVCLKPFHRDDEPLVRLFLDDAQTRRLNRLWQEHRFVTQWPITENKILPQFIGFTTQDQPKELVAFYEAQREPFRKRAEAFEHELEAAAPAQLEKLREFASLAFRRPLREREEKDLLALYDTLRKKGNSHEDAFRGTLARIFVSPSFLFHVEHAPPGKQPGPVNDWELGSRLSYFLWSSVPDKELRRLASRGALQDPDVLAAQAKRMLQDPKLRSLAIEFGTQMIHVRGFDQLKEKNEPLFPMFNEELRKTIYEESILFFQDLFQHDRPVTRLIDADDTYLNETLAKHYGVPGVAGPQWRRVEGVKKYGRGGILGLASVQTKEAGASRTSPVLRGNWVVETLLGEKLPRPPANVPRLPEDERGNDGLTVRQLVAKHTAIPECAVCHVRIDPFGFALERYDPIGRWRDRDLGGLLIDTRVKLKDGTEFDGIDGLRQYLLTKKKDVVVRLFCRKLLGYALGRATTLSDLSLIEEMVAELGKNDGRVTAAVMTIIRSPQFRMIRGADAE